MNVEDLEFLSGSADGNEKEKTTTQTKKTTAKAEQTGLIPVDDVDDSNLPF
jgi:hypothetical protein